MVIEIYEKNNGIVLSFKVSASIRKLDAIIETRQFIKIYQKRNEGIA